MMARPMNEWISNYITAQKAALDSIPTEAVAALIEKLKQALNDDLHALDHGTEDREAPAGRARIQI